MDFDLTRMTIKMHNCEKKYLKLDYEEVVSTVFASCFFWPRELKFSEWELFKVLKYLR